MPPNELLCARADHGEYLDEYGRYGHGITPRYPPIVEVPWIMIKNIRGYNKNQVLVRDSHEQAFQRFWEIF